ncbi:uncharacterized protein LOC127738990 isoform X5 [Mytilus californianus]|uniref:uncharacterized protein LOC127738990 isoform X5 n=1 Tax=Mytilus californianus TaxID=6549 RepID=UPI0022466021|nr:uncharacterized protein LOC127738990 isoform X5 [Mytilus californianus]
MASSNKDVCNLCYDDGTSTEAVTWCTECEVFLCTDCEKHHKKLKTSKDHKTISTKDFNKLPKFMQEISSHCKDHKKKFEIYCSFHACPCCVICITDKHQKCQEMKPLSDILKQVKSSASVQLFKKDLKDVMENFEEIIKYLNSRMKTSNIQKQKASEQIRSMRKSIDDFLNKLEQEILDDLESKQSQLKSKMNTLLQQLKTQANQISQLQSEFSQMTQYATELQMYVGLKEIEKTTSQAAQYIEPLKSGGQLDENNLEVTISSELKSILKDVKSFGVINLNTSPFPLQVNSGSKDQAQNLVQAIPDIDQIKPSMLRKLTIPEYMKSINIFACRILPDGKYSILDSSLDKSHLLLFRNDGMFLREVVAFTGSSFDTCFVRTNTVAVILGSERQTVLVDVDKNEIIKKMDICKSGSVVSDGQMLVFASMEYNSTTVNLNNEKNDKKGFRSKVLANHVALFKGNIYSTLTAENIVRCFKSTGELLWSITHHSIVSPRGLALDKNGFVYIVSRGNNGISV